MTNLANAVAYRCGAVTQLLDQVPKTAADPASWAMLVEYAQLYVAARTRLPLGATAGEIVQAVDRPDLMDPDAAEKLHVWIDDRWAVITGAPATIADALRAEQAVRMAAMVYRRAAEELAAATDPGCAVVTYAGVCAERGWLALPLDPTATADYCVEEPTRAAAVEELSVGHRRKVAQWVIDRWAEISERAVTIHAAEAVGIWGVDAIPAAQQDQSQRESQP